MAIRPGQPYEPYGVAKPERKWSMLQIIMIALTIIALVVIIVAAWVLFSPALFHVAPAPTKPTIHW